MQEDIDKRFTWTEYVVRASLSEQQCLREKHHKQIKWHVEPNGVVYTIAMFDNKPIQVTFTWAVINYKRVLFFYCSSEMCDNSMINEWMKENCQPLYHDKVALCDTGSFEKCLRFCTDTIFEHEAKVGDIIESPNGNRYLILPNSKQIYIGNGTISNIPESTLIALRPKTECTIINHIDLTYGE